MTTIKGFCPMGCGNTLFVADGGYITCSFVNCPDPAYVSSLLDEQQTDHIVKFTEDGFTVQHPLRERKNDLMSCDLHLRLMQLDGAPVKPGTYIFKPNITGKPWSFLPVEGGK